MRNFIFNVEGDESRDIDDVVGCISEDERVCVCNVCNADCIYRGSMRAEVA